MECHIFAKAIINNISLITGNVYSPTTEQLHLVCEILAGLDLSFNDSDMYSLLYQYCPPEMANVISNIKIKNIDDII